MNIFGKDGMLEGLRRGAEKFGSSVAKAAARKAERRNGYTPKEPEPYGRGMGGAEGQQESRKNVTYLKISLGNSEYEVEIMDSTHVRMRVAGTDKWGIPQHVEQLHPEVIEQLKKFGVMDASKFLKNASGEIEKGKWGPGNPYTKDGKTPAAACSRCGGWTSQGGMSQHAKDKTATADNLGRAGCMCEGVVKNASPLKVSSNGSDFEVEVIDPTHLRYRLVGTDKWATALHVQQLEQNWIDQLKAAGAMDERKYMRFTNRKNADEPRCQECNHFSKYHLGDGKGGCSGTGRDGNACSCLEPQSEVKNAEQDSRPDPRLYRAALEVALSQRNDYVKGLIEGMNPRKLSPADIEMLQDVIKSGDPKENADSPALGFDSAQRSTTAQRSETPMLSKCPACGHESEEAWSGKCGGCGVTNAEDVGGNKAIKENLSNGSAPRLCSACMAAVENPDGKKTIEKGGIYHIIVKEGQGHIKVACGDESTCPCYNTKCNAVRDTKCVDCGVPTVSMYELENPVGAGYLCKECLIKRRREHPEEFDNASGPHDLKAAPKCPVCGYNSTSKKVEGKVGMRTCDACTGVFFGHDDRDEKKNAGHPEEFDNAGTPCARCDHDQNKHRPACEGAGCKCPSFSRGVNNADDTPPVYRVTYDGPHIKDLQVELHLGPMTDEQIKEYFQKRYVQPTKILKIERVNARKNAGPETCAECGQPIEHTPEEIDGAFYHAGCAEKFVRENAGDPKKNAVDLQYFTFVDPQGEVSEISAVDEAAAWKGLSQLWATPVEECKKMVKMTRQNAIKKNAGHAGPQAWEGATLERRAQWLEAAGMDFNQAAHSWGALSQDVRVALGHDFDEAAIGALANADNPRCDGAGPHSAGEVRLLAIAGGANALLCRRCFEKEAKGRPSRPKWDSARVYQNAFVDSSEQVKAAKAEVARCEQVEAAATTPEAKKEAGARVLAALKSLSAAQKAEMAELGLSIRPLRKNASDAELAQAWDQMGDDMLDVLGLGDVATADPGTGKLHPLARQPERVRREWKEAYEDAHENRRNAKPVQSYTDDPEVKRAAEALGRACDESKAAQRRAGDKLAAAQRIGGDAEYVRRIEAEYAGDLEAALKVGEAEQRAYADAVKAAMERRNQLPNGVSTKPETLAAASPRKPFDLADFKAWSGGFAPEEEGEEAVRFYIEDMGCKAPKGFEHLENAGGLDDFMTKYSSKCPGCGNTYSHPRDPATMSEQERRDARCLSCTAKEQGHKKNADDRCRKCNAHIRPQDGGLCDDCAQLSNSTVYCCEIGCNRVAHDSFEGRPYCSLHLPERKNAGDSENPRCESCGRELSDAEVDQCVAAGVTECGKCRGLSNAKWSKPGEPCQLGCGTPLEQSPNGVACPKCEPGQFEKKNAGTVHFLFGEGTEIQAVCGAYVEYSAKKAPLKDVTCKACLEDLSGEKQNAGDGCSFCGHPRADHAGGACKSCNKPSYGCGGFDTDPGYAKDRKDKGLRPGQDPDGKWMVKNADVLVPGEHLDKDAVDLQEIARHAEGIEHEVGEMVEKDAAVTNSEETCPECGVDLSKEDHRKSCALRENAVGFPGKRGVEEDFEARMNSILGGVARGAARYGSQGKA